MKTLPEDEEVVTDEFVSPPPFVLKDSKEPRILRPENKAKKKVIIRYYSMWICVHVCKSLGVDDMSINLGGKYLLLQYLKLRNYNFYVKSTGMCTVKVDLTKLT